MKRLSVGFVVALLTISSCGGEGSLSADEEVWCLDNPDVVDDAAGDLGLLDFVDVFYVVNGDGLESDGDPKLSDANIELSEDMRARNSADADALFDDLMETYLRHSDGQEACSAAYAEES